MQRPHEVLLTLGGLLLVGLVAHVVGRRTAVPRVTLLVLLGILIGPSGMGLLPDLGESWFPIVANMALVMVGFLLGEKLKLSRLRRMGRQVLTISVAVVLATAVAVFAGLLAIGAPWPLALLLAAIAPSTDPAATIDVIVECRAKGRFSAMIEAIVAVDDAWGLVLFTLALSSIEAFSGSGTGMEALAAGAWEMGGAITLGVALGVPMAYLTGRIEPGEPTLAEALGTVLLCGGIALWLEISFLLAAMTMGMVVAQRAKHHQRPFHAIEGVESPFLILFFLLAGASLDVAALPGIGALGAVYVAMRVVGRISRGLGGRRCWRTAAGLAHMDRSGAVAAGRSRAGDGAAGRAALPGDARLHSAGDPQRDGSL